MIRLNNLKLYFGEQVIFDDLNWHIKRQERIGLIGANGAGKTTLLRTIINEQHPDQGKILVSKGITLGYLPQHTVAAKGRKLLAEVLSAVADLKKIEQEIHSLQESLSHMQPDEPGYQRDFKRLGELQHLFEASGGFHIEVEAQKILHGLGFSVTDFEKPVETFSGGWQMRVAMAKLLLQKPSLLLLDEPTNHLDIPAMEWLESYLQNYDGTVVIVSHDRYFLERIVNKIALLERGELTEYSGSFSFYEEKRKLIEEQMWQQYERQKEEIARLEHFIERFRYKATKASQVQSRVKQLEKIKRIIPPSARKKIHFYFPTAVRSGQIVADVQNVAKKYDEKLVFEKVNLRIERGEKIALVGVNGAGKSTFCRLVSGSDSPTKGSIEIGYRVKAAFYTQETANNLDGTQTVFEDALEIAPYLDNSRLRTLLGCFLFTGDEVTKPVHVLSGGEKSRLSLAKLLLQESNFLILDEPTNHLDENSKEVLQDALKAYQGTLILVSHDRYFLDKVVDRVIEIRDGQVRDFLGNYSDYLERKKLLDAAAEEAKPVAEKVVKKTGKKSKEEKRAEAEARQREYRKRKAEKNKLKPVESRIEELETRKAGLEEIMAQPDFYANAEQVKKVNLEYKKINDELPGLYEQWEALMA